MTRQEMRAAYEPKDFTRRMRPGEWADLGGLGSVTKLPDGTLRFCVPKRMRVTFYGPDGGEAPEPADVKISG